MKLRDAVNEYIAYKRGLGMRFNTDARSLLAFCRTMGTATSLQRIPESKIESFLSGTGSPTLARNRKHYTLLGFNRFVVGRGYSTSLSLPTIPPTKTRTFVPYVLSREELRRLLQAIPQASRQSIASTVHLAGSPAPPIRCWPPDQRSHFPQPS
jgi:site-specific recombinase XerD